MSTLTMQVDKVSPFDNEDNWQAYLWMNQLYEAEFAPWTHASPDERGFYNESSPLGRETFGYICLVNDTPFGFAVIQKHSPQLHEVREFFIHPKYRLQGFGREFFYRLTAEHPGSWVVKEIEAATWARDFWQRVLIPFDFKEHVIDDQRWGRVYKQSFKTPYAPVEPTTGTTKPTIRLRVM